MILYDRLREMSRVELGRRMVLGAILREPLCRRLIPGFKPSPDALPRDEGDSPTQEATGTPPRESR